MFVKKNITVYEYKKRWKEEKIQVNRDVNQRKKF